MLDRLQDTPPDALLALIAQFAADEREDKIDLGVGVYRTDDGATPVFGAIKAAEQRLWEEQDSKSYLGPEGDRGFVHALMPIIFGSDATMGGRIEGVQTPGGTGAVRLAIALAERAGVTRVHVGTPSWPNHIPIIEDVGLEAVTFQHSNADGSADLDALLEIIRQGREGDAVLIHACCHNPSGIDYTDEQWDAIADALADSPVLPIIDSAYQGLGTGLEEDAAGLRKVLAKVPYALIAYSCDKNFGLYRDRVGAFYAKVAEPAQMPAAMSNAAALARANWSMPPDHGGAAVRIVLRDEDLRQQWLDELDGMRQRLRWVRATLAAAQKKVEGVPLAHLEEQNGLFAMLPLNKDQIAKLREDHAVYMAGSGRINIAGLTKGNIDKFIAALADVAG
ncbi:aromatic amino acid transaminase [Citromicrobium bathyomarinum]|uniref:amino acid aminotransferase n=1 Tax=Citromicrobium sp. WPS32 TaxID=1634517 RepID=UPI0006C913CD|nr:aromatic amino acid transaminase [Citromicrobium sp. WPS32]KPM15982.1 aromatic amino acid aminotransferase [Citromicrobium sp. WPS32]|tara:strand:+ start:1195 stop:2373 length:1179 start_codon:yes stop_codon:yes gene_type:complete